MAPEINEKAAYPRNPRASCYCPTNSLSPPKRGEGWGEGNRAWTSSPRPSPPFGEEREKRVVVPRCACATPTLINREGELLRAGVCQAQAARNATEETDAEKIRNSGHQDSCSTQSRKSFWNLSDGR